MNIKIVDVKFLVSQSESLKGWKQRMKTVVHFSSLFYSFLDRLCY